MGTATPTRRHEGRYTFGPRDKATGRTPVYVDGAQEPSGYVWSTGHGGQPWTAEGSDSIKATYPDFDARRWQAAERIVDLIDARARQAEETVRERSAADVPEGWRVASWDEITRYGLRRVRLPRRFAYLDPSTPKSERDAGPRYVAEWYAEPIRIRSVSRHGRAKAEDQARFGDFLTVIGHGTGWGQTINGNHAIACGVLVPVDSPVKTLSDRFCPQCGRDGLLYARGQRTACGPCTAKALGWAEEDLPHPDHHDTAPVVQPGDAVRMSTAATDGRSDIHYGTVREWEARLDGSSVAVRGYQARRVAVSFPYGYGTNCDPTALRKVDAVVPVDPEPRHGFRIGQEVVRYDYNREGAAFERRGFVVGFGVDADGEPVIRFGVPCLPATPYPVGEVFRIGSLAAWRASRPRRPQDV
jgi:ribosomal protein S27AE